MRELPLMGVDHRVDSGAFPQFLSLPSPYTGCKERIVIYLAEIQLLHTNVVNVF